MRPCVVVGLSKGDGRAELEVGSARDARRLAEAIRAAVARERVTVREDGVRG